MFQATVTIDGQTHVSPECLFRCRALMFVEKFRTPFIPRPGKPTRPLPADFASKIETLH